ncbi:hypothetical protein KHP57_09630 [Algiphilus sp. NNCM1]|uniref:hypothetical protein n=1 Tax=Algiphilus sp. TaxID=1872431 RepID=UPI001CA6B58D|nr:hypothetical protein [Algiphilus sp.]MBY8965965.1 hypothetical protein [Algiphilus acroporae]MCI5062387.1 hypothetical protein [Algiphilus sp.]MCI5102313.1 hypothetical protein [Algiphilus sp.]
MAYDGTFDDLVEPMQTQEHREAVEALATLPLDDILETAMSGPVDGDAEPPACDSQRDQD